MTKKRGAVRTIDNGRLLGLAIGEAFLPQTRAFVPWEGHGEHALVDLYASRNDLVDLVSQPFRLELKVNGRRVRYTPDYEARFLSGPSEVGEARSAARLADPEVQERLRAVAMALAEQGKTFRVYSSRSLTDSVVIRNIRLLKRYALVDVSAGDRAAISELTAALTPPLKLGVLLHHLRKLQIERPQVYHLLWKRNISFDWTTLLSDGSVLGTSR